MAGDTPTRPASEPANPSSTRTSRRRRTITPGETLEPRLVLHAPELGPLADVTLLAGAPLHVALDATDDHGGTLTYQVTSDNPNVIPVLSPGTNRFWQLDVAGFGVMTFQLFEDLAPRVTSRIIELTNQGFYDGLTFHRIIDNFMIQGGDPLGNGTGGSDLGNFDDQFHLDLQHTSKGLLSFAKSGDDTNNSQFFITDVPTRHLDFNHSIFGFLVSGDNVRDAINSVATGTNDRPTTPVVINSARIIENHEDAVVRLKTTSTSVTGTANITVRVENSQGDATTRTFKVTVQPDTNNAPPFLGEISAPIVIGPERQTITIPIQAFDAENDRPQFLILSGDPSQIEVVVDNVAPQMSNGVATANVTIRAINNTVGGIFELFVNVQQFSGGSSQNSDLQRVPIIVTPLKPTLTLVGEDTGAPGDGVTRDTTLEFQISGALELAEITLWRGDEVIGTFTAPKDEDLEFNETAAPFRITVPAPLAEGPHVFSVSQRVRRDAIVNYRNLVTPESERSAPIAAWVFTTAPSLVTPTGMTVISPGTSFSYDAQSDREGIPGTVYSLVKSPLGMAINPTTGLIQWTPLPSTLGTETVTVRVTDGAGNVTDRSFDIRINSAPTFDAITRPAIGEGATESFVIAANDPDVAIGDTLSYTLIGAVPEGAAIDAQTGRFTWTPNEQQGGATYTFTVRVVDGVGAEATTTFTIRVDETNVAPIFRPIGDQFVSAGATVSLTFVADDADIPVNAITYSLKTAPAGATINPATGAFHFSVPTDPGQLEYPVTVVANDGQGGTAELTLLIVVNVAPVFPDIADQEATEHQAFQFDAVATDANTTDELTYELLEGPVGASIDPATGRIRWTPTESDGGTQVRFTVRVTDRGLLQDTVSFLVSVVEVDDPPTFMPIDEPFRVALDGELAVQLTAVDPDIPASSITYRLIDPPEGATIDPVTGMFRYVPPQGSTAGRITINVLAEEDDGVAAEQSFDIVLNVAPVVHEYEDIEIDERVPFELHVHAHDANVEAGDDELTFSLDVAPQGMTIDPVSGELRWTPTEEQGPGVHEVRIRATDLGGLSSTHAFHITVREVPNAPDLEAVPDQQAAEGQELRLTLVGSDGDPDSGPLIYSLVSGPAGAQVDSVTGVFTWTPGETDGGTTTTFTVRVTDSTGLSTDRTFHVDVAEVNDAPQLAEFAPRVVREGSLLEVTASAIDTDLPAGPLTYSLQSAPDGMTIDPATGVIRWTPSNVQGGRSYDVLVTVTDPQGLSDAKTLRVNVLDSAQGVRLIVPGTVVLARGESLAVQLQISDPNEGTAGAPTFSLIDGPDGAVLDPATGFLTFLPGVETPVGPILFTVAVQVGGPEGPLTIESFVVQVGGIDALPSLAEAYEDLDSFLPGTTPSGPLSTIELLQRGGTPASLSQLPSAVLDAARNGSGPRFTNFNFQVDSNVNLIHRPKSGGTENDGGARPASATEERRTERDRAERRENTAPLGARSAPSNVRPTSRSTSNDAPPQKTAQATESARDKVVAEFDRVADLKPANNRLAWYTSTNTTVPRPVLVWTAERGGVKATNGQLLAAEQVVEIPKSPIQLARPVSIGEAYGRGVATPAEAAQDEALEQAAAEAPAPQTPAVKARAAVASAALFMPLLVSELRDRDDPSKGWRRWFRGG